MRLEAKEAPVPSTGLANISAIPAIVPADFFKAGGSEDVLARLELEVRSRAASLDISTESGRKAIASLAYQVARSKTALDEAGEKWGEDLRRQKEAIDSERRKVRGRCDLLKEEVRKPLTDWENGEKTRVATHEQCLQTLRSFSVFDVDPTIGDIEMAMSAVKLSYEGHSWEEF